MSAVLNLTLLQDMILRDPGSYKEEFLEQVTHFKNILNLLNLQPQSNDDHLMEMVHFFSHVGQCYPYYTKSVATDILQLLSSGATLLVPAVRMSLCKALMVMQSKQLVSVEEMTTLFFEMVKCRDKALRKYLFSAIVGRIKRLNVNGGHHKVNSYLMAFMCSKTTDSMPIVSRFATLILIELYRRQIWRNARVVNVLAQACLSPVAKIAVGALYFFQGHHSDGFEEDNNAVEGNNSSDEEMTASRRSLKELTVAYKVHKKSKKRDRLYEKAKIQLSKQRSKERRKAFDAGAIDLIYDSQTFAEKLFDRLQRSNDRFEVRLLLMGLISRLIGTHRLQLLNFYPFLQRYLQPHQNDVTKLLLFAAQASHELVPPEAIGAVVQTICDNFVTDRNSNEAITVGLNTVREILSHCPHAVNEELLSDLTAYRTFKNKNVSSAARSIIQLFRAINPAILCHRDRGKPTEAMVEVEAATSVSLPQFGAATAVDYVPGAECLIGVEPQSDDDHNSDDSENDDDDFPVIKSDDEGNENSEAANGAAGGDMHLKAAEICATRILSSKEFRKVASRQILKQVLPARSVKRMGDAMEITERTGDLAKLTDIEKLTKRPKQTREEKIEGVVSGREGRSKFGKPKANGPHVGRNKANLARNKVFLMVKHGKATRKKKNRSFRDQQRALVNYMRHCQRRAGK